MVVWVDSKVTGHSWILLISVFLRFELILFFVFFGFCFYGFFGRSAIMI